MAQWKRVYVPGKGYRWTDGKGNYKTNNPSFRNPANAAVDAGASAAKSTAKSAANTASKSASATAQAASRTAENERNASSNAIGYGARKKAEEQANKAPKKSTIKGVSSTNDITRLRREQEAARLAQLEKANRKPAPSKPEPKPPAPKPEPSRPAATRPATPAAPKKPAAPASSKDRRVSASTANRESGNYGTSRTNNPMIDDAMKARMRQREERQAGASGSSKPEDKSKYVASDGRQYKGPAFGNDAKSSNTASSKTKSSDKGMTLAERMRKRRQGLA